MKHYWKITAVLVVAFALTACEEMTGGLRQDRSTGNTAEILVVVQNEDQWEGPIGDTIRACFLDYQYGLPQPETRYDLKHIKASSFSEIYRKHKSILEVAVDPKFDKAIAESSEDPMAAPQRYIKISAPNDSAWVALFDKQKEVYLQWFDKVERERTMSALSSSVDDNISNAIARRMGFKMTVPKGFYVAVDNDEFMWIRKELERSSSCLIIYRTPYQDTLQFEPQNLLAMRDMMVKKYIPGPSEGSYMATENSYMPPKVTRAPDFPAGYTMEMRGMWKVENDFMGGPFVSYTFVDSRTNNLVTVEGYYYEPNQRKRNKMLQLESILYSLQFVD